MPLLGLNNEVVDGVELIFREHVAEKDVSILSKITTQFPSLTHEQRIHVIRQVGQRLR